MSGKLKVKGGKKRRRLAVCHDPAAIIPAERLHDKDVDYLRELAACRGLPVYGAKWQLIKRLSGGSDKKSQEIDRVIATKKGGALLDKWLPDHIKLSCHVLQQGEEIYNAMLVDEEDKFYVIQVLESDDGRTFWVFNRWGRVGMRGQDKLNGYYDVRDVAITEFLWKFFEKTKNQWSDRKNFKCYPECYTWLEMGYGEAGETPVRNKSDESSDTQLRETT